MILSYRYWRSQAKLTFGWPHLAAPLALAAALLLGEGRKAGLSSFQLIRWVEFLIPLFGAFLAAPAIARDKDLGVAELQAAKPGGIEYPVLIRHILTVGYTVIAAMVLAWAAGGKGREPYFLLNLCITALPSLLFFSALSMTGALAFGSAAAGFALATVVWGGSITYSLLSPTGSIGWITPFPRLLMIPRELILSNRLIYLALWILTGCVARILLHRDYVMSGKE